MPPTQDALGDILKIIQFGFYAKGYGITQIEDEVHGIRGLIQDYFDSFNPHRRWWDRRRPPAKKADPLE